MDRIRHFLELIRFSHTLFALPFAALSAAMVWSETPFRWSHLMGFLLCMVFARSAAMAFNRLVDRNLDALNPRTAGRHLPRGILKVRQVQIFTVICAAGFVLSTLLFLPNYWPLVASGPVLAFLFAYSYTKRFTPLSHIWLGTALALAPPGVWLAIQGHLAWPPVVLGLAVIFWVTGFDIIYACQDYDFDRQQGLWSIPVAVGVRTALRLAAFSHGLMVICLAVLPFLFAGFGWLYWVGIAVVTLLLGYEHALVRPDDLRRVNEAFFHVNAVVSVGLFVIGALDIWTL
ncbi:MAG: 4-hydroxybenzoate octaprenyltransferase [Thermogutta sp.]